MFLTRLISGAVLLILSFTFIYFGGYALAGICLLLSVTAYHEMMKALHKGDKKYLDALSIFGYIAIVIYYALLAFTNQTTLLCMAVVFSIIIFLTIYVLFFPKFVVEEVMGSIFAYLYAPLMLSFVYLTRELTNGSYIVWMIFISSWGYDTCAYCVGMLTGKTIGNHKCFPKLSPKKSYEGLIGGVIGAALIAWLYGHFYMGVHVTDIPNLEWMLAIIAAVGAFIAQVGDLAASAVKRNKDIKDYGNCIPGHGGVLDRFDSMIFTAPITYFLAVLLLNSIH